MDFLSFPLLSAVVSLMCSMCLAQSQYSIIIELLFLLIIINIIIFADYYYFDLMNKLVVSFVFLTFILAFCSCAEMISGHRIVVNTFLFIH